MTHLTVGGVPLGRTLGAYGRTQVKVNIALTKKQARASWCYDGPGVPID